MTIAAGFACPDGIVIAADTKESYGESDHTYVNKIELVRHFIEHSHRPKTQAAYAAIVGSGDASLIDHIVGHIKKAFQENVNSDLSAFRQSLSELMPRLYASDAIASYPHSDPSDLYTQLLVAVRPNYREKAALFLINSSLVDEVPEGVRIIGMGTMQETANEVNLLKLNMYESATAALYLIYEAKRHYSYVGGVTHVYSIPHPPTIPGAGHPPQSERILDQGQKESLFKELRNWHQRMVVAIGSPVVSEESYKQLVEEYIDALNLIRRDFAELENQERSRYLRQAEVEAKYFKQTMEAGLAKMKAEKDNPPAKAD